MGGKSFKLCNFGSATKSILDPKSSDYKPQKVDEMYDEYEKYTTFMYRPPEMIDKYLKYKVDGKAGVWMLGCVIFTMCFFQHPFAES